MGRYLRIVTAIAAIVVGLVPPAAATQTDAIDDLVSAEIKRQNLPGLSLAVIKDGRIVKAAGYGFADRERRVKATPGTIFKIGSVSKQFIATGIMLLAQESRLAIADPVRKYLDDAPASWDAITIRHLLTHTSGLIREAPGFDPTKLQPDREVIRKAYAQPLLFRPGEKWTYSNVGYYVLADIIREITGQAWGEYLNEKVFKPSGMMATYTTEKGRTQANHARGYTDNDDLRPAADWVALRPSGAFSSTVTDLARWEQVLLTGKLLTDATKEQMRTRVVLNNASPAPYGFGWHIGSFNGRTTVYHGGGLPGFNAFYQRFIDDRLTVIVLMNTDDADIGSLVMGIANRYLGQQ